MRASVLPVSFGLALMLASGVARAQTGGPEAPGAITVSEAPPSIFSSLFPHPTNNNGYEEWARAADLVKNDENVDIAAAPGASLAFHRQVLADPAAMQALALLHAGLEKPVRAPQRRLDENTLLPELSPFRRLARLLCLQMHVELADGRANAAITDLRDGLVFGHHVQTDTLISGLVGVAIDTMVLNEFAPHLDALSASQCNQVLHVVDEGLNTESPVTRLLAQERASLKMLEARRSDADSMLAFLDAITSGDESGSGGDPEEIEALQNLQQRLIDHPRDLNPIINEAQARVAALYNQVFLNLRLPITQRKPLTRDKAGSPGFWLFHTITPNLQPVLNKYDTIQEELRLLGVHALIRRYRLEHRALPNTLAQLHAPEMVQDPFTGSPVVYQRNGDLYSLYSQGPFKLDGAGQAVSRERMPVMLKITTHAK